MDRARIIKYVLVLLGALLLCWLAALEEQQAQGAPRPFQRPRKALPRPRAATEPKPCPPGLLGVWTLSWDGQAQQWEFKEDGRLYHQCIEGRWESDGHSVWGSWSGYYFHLTPDGKGAWRGKEHFPCTRGPAPFTPLVVVFVSKE